MMKILQFKLGGEYDYNVTFETGFEKRKIQTNDQPKGDLLTAASNVVITSVRFFKFENISAVFRQITFNYPDNGPQGFVIELTVKTKDVLDIKHTLKSERIELVPIEEAAPDSKILARIKERNDLIQKIITLREEIESYALGARMQEDLPFDAEESSEGEASLFDDGDDGEGEGDDQQRRRSELHIVENGGEE
jgi:hypothetical protein